MGPGEFLTVLAIVSGIAGTVITLSVSAMRHRERMAGLRGQGDAPLAQTMRLLTETLEAQHERLQTLTRRLDAVDGRGSEPAARTAERDAANATPARLALPDDGPATAEMAAEPATEPVRARVRA